MSTQTLRSLEERLNREAPAISWSCDTPTSAKCVAGTDVPVEIQVTASQEGVPIKGSPFHLSGECLNRWGVDTSATLICNELAPSLAIARKLRGMEWDRLAEI